MVNSDKHWARLGLIDPYLSTVKTLDPYKLDPTLGRDIGAYFESGERYLSDLFQSITQIEGLVDAGIDPDRVVKFWYDPEEPVHPGTDRKSVV